jgi:hypothetical protein
VRWSVVQKGNHLYEATPMSHRLNYITYTAFGCIRVDGSHRYDCTLTALSSVTFLYSYIYLNNTNVVNFLCR